jgi:ribonuclease G
VIKSEETIAIEFERRMRELAPHVGAEALLIQMNPRVSQEFTGHDARALRAIEADTGKWFHFEGSEGLPLEHFAVLMEADREQVLERALPFREGEEVYLEIIEPHMYNAGDAVAKVDGYIISVRGGEGSVGYKRLVRIEQVGRTEAVAVLIDQPPVKLEAPKPTPAPKPAARRRRAAVKPDTAEPESGVESAEDLTVPDDPTAAEIDAAESAAAEIAQDEADAAPKPRAARSRARGRRAAKPVDGLTGEAADTASAEPASQDDPEAAAKVSGDGTADESAGTGADGVESTVRRRGRRGGRRRSTAKAGSALPADESSSE